MRVWRRSPLPDSVTATMPPPAKPSTSMRSSSACIASIFDLNSAACFIRPMKSAMNTLYLLVVAVVGFAVRLRTQRQVIGIGCGRAGGRAHVDDLGAGEFRQHRRHQRIGAYAVFQLGLAGLGLRPQTRRAGLG